MSELYATSGVRHPGLIARLLDERETTGVVLVSTEDLVEQSGLSPIAVKRQLAHLSHRVARLPGRPEAFLLVAPQHRLMGVPPVGWWLDAYMRLRGQPYYLALMSAAEMYGSSHQAVQVTQVMTDRPTRPLELGRVRVVFFVKKNVERTPVQQPPGQHARLAVSTPEATALDLLDYNGRIGGVSRAMAVIAGLKGAMTSSGLKKALDVDAPRALHQRLGYIFQNMRWESFAQEVEKRLAGDVPPVKLQAGAPTDPASVVSRRWGVVENVELQELDV